MLMLPLAEVVTFSFAMHSTSSFICKDIYVSFFTIAHYDSFKPRMPVSRTIRSKRASKGLLKKS